MTRSPSDPTTTRPRPPTPGDETEGHGTIGRCSGQMSPRSKRRRSGPAGNVPTPAQVRQVGRHESTHSCVWQNVCRLGGGTMPMNWWPSDEAAGAVIDSEGPWPSPSPVSNGICTPFDVDRYDGLAVVVGYGWNRKGREVLGSDEFQQDESGKWEHLTGGGAGWSFGQRWDIQEAREDLHFRMGGSSGKSPFDDRREFSFAVFMCGPAVASVEVGRRYATRVADVSAGPGWLTVLWTPDDGATVTAYTAVGQQSFRWTSPSTVA